jgi:hypothetical protein
MSGLSTGIGVKFAIGTLGAVVSMSAVSNAKPAEATLAAGHGVTQGDFLYVNASGWEGLSGMALKAGAVDSNDVTLLGFDASNTTNFIAGGGGGSVQKVTGLKEISNVSKWDFKGGDRNTIKKPFLDSGREKSMPGTVSAIEIDFEIGDDIASSAYEELVSAHDDAKPRVFRLTFKNGEVMLCAGFVSFNKNPSNSTNDLRMTKGTISVVNDTVRYPAA